MRALLPGRRSTPAGRQWVSGAAKYLVSGLALWLLVRQVDGRVLLATLAEARPVPVAAALALYLFGQAITAYRWHVISRSVGFCHPLGKVVSFYYIGMFFNLFGPSTLGGDVVRSLYLAEDDGRRTVALNTVIFDRLSGLAMLVAVALAAMAAFGRFGLPWPLVLVTVACGAGLIAGWWVVPPLVRRLLPTRNRLRRVVEEEIGPFWRDRGLLARTSAVSISFHFIQIVAVMLIGRALGLAVSWQYYFLFHPLVTIFSALPISLAGLGIREMGYMYFLSQLQPVPRELALAFGVLWLAVLLASSAVGGLVFLANGGAMPALRPSKPQPEA